jgi:hypothetical protein
MSTVREVKEIPDLSPDTAYKQANQAFRNTGFEVWKERPLAWLVMAKLVDEQGTIQANAACRPGITTSITITLDSDVHDEVHLKNLLTRLFEHFDQVD